MWLKGLNSFQRQFNSVFCFCLDIKVETLGFQALLCSASETPQGDEVNGFKHCLNTEDIPDKHRRITLIHSWVRCKCCLNRDLSLFHRRSSPTSLSNPCAHLSLSLSAQKKSLRRRGSVGLPLETGSPSVCVCH